MANFTGFQYEYPIDYVTPWNTQYFMQLQNNVVSFVSQFLPLVGAQMQGVIIWDPTQTFPSTQVSIADPSYPHTGFYVTLADHIKDPIHGSPTMPLPHAISHAIGGTDLLYGSTLSIGPSAPTTSIKSYIDTSVAAVSGAAYPGPSPSSRWEIGGADPVFGNLIPVDSAHPTLDLRTYVNNTVSAAIATGGSTSPTYTNITISSGTINTNGLLNLQSKGSSILSDDGTNTNLKTSKVGSAAINLGSQDTPFGSFGPSGYSIGSSNYGPNGMLTNGNISSNGDIQASRTALGTPAVGVLFLGANTNAYLSYNYDVPNQFYISKPITFSNNLTLAAGKSFTIPGVYNIVQSGPPSSAPTFPGARSDGTNLVINAASGGAISLGYDDATLTALRIGPSGSFASFTTAGLAMGSTVLSASGGAIAGPLSLNGGYTTLGGDLGVASSGVAGALYFGRTSAAGLLDFGRTIAGAFSFSGNGNLLAQIKTDGTINTGASIYGPTLASVAGIISSTKTISAGIGLDISGNAGFAFSANYNTGMFSASAGDLRLVLSGTPVLTMNPSTSTFSNSLTTTGQVTATSANITGPLTVSGNLALNAGLQTGATTITKFRIKMLMPLGNTSGTVTTGIVYPYVPMINYSGGQIESIRITAASADTGGTPSSFTIYKNASVIGNVSFGSGQISAVALPTPNPTPLANGDILHAVCTQAGGAAGVSIYLEASQLIY